MRRFTRLSGLTGLGGLGARARDVGQGLRGLAGSGGPERLVWFGAGLSAGSTAWLVGEMALGPLRAPPSVPPRPTLAPLRVQVDGAVEQPGVYAVAPGARVEDALRAAGGITSAADASGLNLVARVADGQRIAVPARPLARAAPGLTPAPRDRPRPTRTPGTPRAVIPSRPTDARSATSTPVTDARPPPTAVAGGSGPNRAIASPW
jgi:DNA uptake protein ComE-like DNA-binding protein